MTYANRNGMRLSSDQTVLQRYQERPQQIKDIEQTICHFFDYRVTRDSPYKILDYFTRLFIDQDETVNESVYQCLYTLSLLNQFVDKKEDFFRILEQCLYILLKEWIKRQEYKYIYNLSQVFEKNIENNPQKTLTEFTIKNWLIEFKKTRNFRNVDFLISKCEFQPKKHWTDYFNVYILIEHSLNPKKGKEERKISRLLAQQLQQRFTLQLKMYMARSQWSFSPTKIWEKPTKIDDKRLQLIEKVILKKKSFGYHNIANIFLRQTQDLKYTAFKVGFLKYLLYSFENSKDHKITHLHQRLKQQLDHFNQENNNQKVTPELIHQTCYKTIDYLIDPRNCINQNHPITDLLFHKEYLVLSIILLKIILIAPGTYDFLMCRLASFIYAYRKSSAVECKWLIGFLETFKVVLAFGVDQIQGSKISRQS